MVPIYLVDMFMLSCVYLFVGISYSYASVNLALRQPTNQSAVLKNLTSDRAVNGKYDFRPSELSCAVTPGGAKEVWWQVELNQSSIVSHIHLVFEKTTAIVSILRNHLVYVSNSSKIGSGLVCYEEKRKNPGLINQVDCLLMGRYVTYFSNHLYNGNAALLLICEVEVYGCPLGFYGQKCKQVCSNNCLNQICEPDHGYCIGGCKSGFSGNRCLQECDTGWFGPNCGVGCSDTCLNGNCYGTNGSCIRCVSGKTGPFCNQIIEGEDTMTTEASSVIDEPMVKSSIMESRISVYHLALGALALSLMVVLSIFAVFLHKYRRLLKRQLEMEKKFTAENISPPTVVNHNLGTRNIRNIQPLPLKTRTPEETFDAKGNQTGGPHDCADNVNNRINNKKRTQSLDYVNDPLGRDSGIDYEDLKRNGIFPRESHHLYDRLQ